MSITYAQAFESAEFHISHDGQPCTVWRRAGQTYAMHDNLGRALLNESSGFFVPIERSTYSGYPDWHQITGVNAADFHTPDDCPHARSDRSDDPPISQDTLPGCEQAGYDADGYNADGYDADGYDHAGFNADGFERDTTAGDLDLDELWSGFVYSRFNTPGKQAAFQKHLRENITDPDSVDDLKFCGDCGKPGWGDYLNTPDNGDTHICDSCWEKWSSCDGCGDYWLVDDLNTTLGGSDICAGCRDEYYSYCEDCEGWYRDENSDEHQHNGDGDGCCASPQPEFTVRNDGCEPLRNDTRAVITLPAGVISAEGLTAIRDYLLYTACEPAVGYDLGKVGDAWQLKNGNYTKRLSRMAYTDHKIKLTPETLSQVGCIAREHSAQVSTQIEVTRDLNQDADYFYHDGSCWWNSYAESRCALKTNGGFGLRSFNSSSGIVSGRAWVLPLKLTERGRLGPTFETMTPDAFAVFNGYGGLSGYAAPRILAHMAGWTYRKIDFECSPMYVNPGGYLVAPEEIAERYTDGTLHLSGSQHSDLYGREQTEREQAERELITC
jgi:hypothetical protein